MLTDIFYSQMFICFSGYTATSGGSCKKTMLKKIGFIHIFKGDSFLVNCGSKGFKAYRATAVKLNDTSKHSSVKSVQAKLIDLKS